MNTILYINNVSISVFYNNFFSVFFSAFLRFSYVIRANTVSDFNTSRSFCWRVLSLLNFKFFNFVDQFWSLLFRIFLLSQCKYQSIQLEIVCGIHCLTWRNVLVRSLKQEHVRCSSVRTVEKLRSRRQNINFYF